MSIYDGRNSNNNRNLNYLKEKLISLRQQTELNNQLNIKAKSILNGIYIPHQQSSPLPHKKLNHYRSDKENCGLSSCRPVNFSHHVNYWQQLWLFNDNPMFEYEIAEGFENPIYSFLNTKLSSAQANLLVQFDNQPIMDIYESILDFNSSQQTTKVLETLKLEKSVFKLVNTGDFEISSPESNDSGIQSDDRLNRHSNLSSKTSAENSLYSSVISSKKSQDKLSREASTYSRLDEFNSNCELQQDEDCDELNFAPIIHLEQHELPLGWVRCCDETGIYYWHKPSGTVTRRPPHVELIPPKKNFDINEYENILENRETKNIDQYHPTSSSEDRSIGGSSLSTFSTLSSSVTIPHNDFNSLKPHCNDDDDIDIVDGKSTTEKSNESSKLNVQTRYMSDFTSVSPLSTSSSNSTSSASSSSNSSTLDKLKQARSNMEFLNKTVTQSEEMHPTLRFYVRSLGWVKISEEDLTPDRSSKAVNKCINDLSRGTKDFNDVVARWGDGKDLFMDLEDNNLILLDPIDEKILNRQPITSIRVWGVGRDNGRDFAYVARDKQTKIHMCHVFRCDSTPAKDIANALKDTCRRIIAEKNKLNETETNSNLNISNNHNSSRLKRPNFLPDISVNNSKVDINLKLRSISFNKDENMSQTPPQSSENLLDSMPTPMDEPKKLHYCKYLGSMLVNKAYGMDTLNDAIEKIYSKSLEDYTKMKREKKLRRKKRLSALYGNENTGDENIDLDDDEDMDDIDDYECDLEDEYNAISFDSLLDLNSERKLGCDACVSVSPSTISVKRVNSNSNDQEDVLFEFRIRYLSFMGISNDVRLCGFIVHCVDNTFRCYGFLCENSCGPLCKTIEAACKLRYQKCLDAHPDAAVIANRQNANEFIRLKSLGSFGSQIKNMFDSIKTRNLFSNITFPNKSTKM